MSAVLARRQAMAHLLARTSGFRLQLQQGLARRSPKTLVCQRGFSSGAGNAGGESYAQRFWAWTTQPRPHWRESKVEAAVIFCIFGATGSTSVALVRPVFTKLTGIEGSMREGPWSYRVGSLLTVSPVYAMVLITFGTLSGRHIYFANMGKKILGRFVPATFRPHLACTPAKAKAVAPKTTGS
mmetsp:Transcript_101861/g.180713  ORF Transcript_101861/g.180713 Transcript_101861/m.180713 type:complete len:183 (-) Transcript_101861:110-658(-)